MRLTQPKEIQTAGYRPVVNGAANSPCKRANSLAMALFLGLVTSAQAQIMHVGGEGAIGDTPLPTTAGVAMVPNSGALWAAAGGAGNVYSKLTSRTLTVPTSGAVTLRFTHRYYFEQGWDGGAVYVSKNGAAATYLPAEAFSENSYVSDLSAASNGYGNSNVFTGGEWVFTGQSAGWDSSIHIESTATLGTFNAGDTVAVEFRGGWDDGYSESAPNWEIATVEVSDAAATSILNVDFMTGAGGFRVASDSGLAGPWTYPGTETWQFELNAWVPSSDRFVPSSPGIIDLNSAKLKVVLLDGSLDAGQTYTLFDLSGGSTLAGHYSGIDLPQVSWDLSGLEPGGNGKITALSGLYWTYTWNKGNAAGTYSWESTNWTYSPTDPAPATEWPDGAGTSVICNSKAGSNVWNITSPTITLGSMHLGGDVGANQTLSGLSSTLVFDNGAANASFSRGTDISTTTGAALNFGAITLNSSLDINITSHLTSQVVINAPIGGTGGLNVISATGNYPVEGWSGLVLNGANTYTGDTVISSAGWVNMTNSMKFTVTDSGSNKITGAGTIQLNGSIDIDTSAVTVIAGSWTLVDVATLSEYYGPSFSVTGFTKSGGVWTKTDGEKTWIFNPATGVLALPAAWITSFIYGSATGSIDQTAKTISLTVPYGTNLATVNPTFTLYSGTCADQTSGSAPSPTFAVQNPATYTVIDGSVGVTRVYTVTIAVAPPAPGGVAADLALWLDASDASTMTLNANTVTEWRDKFGGTGKATLKAGTPTWVASGIAAIPTVHFDTSSSMNDGVDRSAGPVTIFYVSRETGGANNRVLSASTNNWLLGYHGGQRNRFYFNGWVNEAGLSSDTAPHLFAATIGGAGQNSTVYAEGGLVASNQNGTQGPNNIQLNGMNGGELSNADISELLVYNRILTSGELNSVGAYLSAKYSLTTSYPGLAEIVTFGVPGYEGVIDQAAKTIVLTVPVGTDLATLAPSFTQFSGTCMDQTSGSPPSPTFAAHSPVTYTIQDGAVTHAYTVTVEEYVPPYTWVKATTAGTYDWESAHWDRAGYPNSAGTAVTCNTQAGTNVWTITSPSITIGSLHLGGDGGANQTLSGVGKTLVFDNGASHASLSRGTDISTTTGAALNFGAITLNSTLDINITSHLTSQVVINAPIGGTGGLNVISATGDYPVEGWSGLVLNGANTYTGDTTISSAGWVMLSEGTGSLKFKVTDSGSNKITGTGTIQLKGTFVIDTSEVTVSSGTWSLVDVASLKEYYAPNFSVQGFTKIGSNWMRTEGGRTWVFDPASGLLSIPAAWITSFNYGIYAGVIDQTAKTIALTVPNLTDLATLNPTFSVSTGTCDQTSGTAPSPTFAYSNPATYTVTDGADVNSYVVTVAVASLGAGKDLTKLYFPGYGYAWATDSSNFLMVVPNSANLSTLAPTYTLSWAASSSHPSGTARNFTEPQVYRITAEDASYTDYTVTVIKSANVGTGYQARVLAGNPVSYWPLDETNGTTAIDLASGLNSMTYGGTYSLNQTGLRSDANPSVLFTNAGLADATNTRAPYNSSLNPSNAYTVECWVKPTTTGSQYLVSMQDRSGSVPSNGRWGYALWKNNGGAGFALQWGTPGTGTGTAQGATAIVAGSVYHVVSTYDGSKVRLYVNGVLDASADAPIYQPASATQPGFSVGSRNGNTPAPSYIQDVALYSRALMIDEIQAHYQNPPSTLSYADWASSRYPSANLTNPAADLDGDGVSNFAEYAFGLDPTKGSSVNPIIVPFDKATHTFSYTRTANTGLTYTVWTSADMQGWNQVLPANMIGSVGAPSSDGVETVAVTLTSPPAGPKLFVRVQAE